jgi:hypothetical protein
MFYFLLDSEQCCYRTFEFMNKDVALALGAFERAAFKPRLARHPIV